MMNLMAAAAGCSPSRRIQLRLSRTTRDIAYLLLLCSYLFQLTVVGLGIKPALRKASGDFFVFHRVGRIAAAGQIHQVYDKATQDRFENRPSPAPGAYFYHPPFELLLFWPFGYLSYPLALWLWRLGILVTVIASVFVLRPEFKPLAKSTGISVSALVFAFFPIAMLFLWQQDSGILLLLFVLAFREYRRGNDFQAGALLGLSLFKFQHAIPAMVLLGLRRKKFVAGFAATAAVLLVISWAMVGSSGLTAYWRILFDHGREDGTKMANLRGLLQYFNASPVVTVFGSLVLGVWCATRKFGDRGAEFSSAVMFAELVAYHGHYYDLVVLLIPVLFVLERAVINRSAVECWPSLLFFSPLYAACLIWNLWYLLALPMLALQLGLASSTSKTRRAGNHWGYHPTDIENHDVAARIQ